MVKEIGQAARAGDKDRHAAVERMSEAFATGHLDKSECDERTTAALQAVFMHELDALTAGLPEAPARRAQARARDMLAAGRRSPHFWLAGTLAGCWVMIMPIAVIPTLPGEMGPVKAAVLVFSFFLGLYIVITTVITAVKAAARRKGKDTWK